VHLAASTLYEAAINLHPPIRFPLFSNIGAWISHNYGTVTTLCLNNQLSLKPGSLYFTYIGADKTLYLIGAARRHTHLVVVWRLYRLSKLYQHTTLDFQTMHFGLFGWSET